MSALIGLIRKNLLDARWMLGVLLLALFWLSWWFVHIAHRIEKAMKAASGGVPLRMLRGLGGEAMDFSTAAIEMAFWNQPFVLLLFCVWAISRGSGAVAGELEKGTIDLILSRPVSRSSFLASQVAVGLAGLVAMAGAMVLGNLGGTRYNTVESAPSVLALSRPAVNLVAFGWAVYGYTFLLSAADFLRWRPILISSVATLAGFVALVISSLPSLDDYRWMARFSIFKAYNPVEVVTKGQTLAFNAGLLGGIGALGVVLGFVIFARRDLPAGS